MNDNNLELNISEIKDTRKINENDYRGKDNKNINLKTFNNSDIKINISSTSNNSRINNYSDFYFKDNNNINKDKVITIDNNNNCPFLDDNLGNNNNKRKFNTDYSNLNSLKNNYNFQNKNIKTDNYINSRNINNITTDTINNSKITIKSENIKIKEMELIDNNNNKYINLNSENSKKIIKHKRSKSNITENKRYVFLENEYVFKKEDYIQEKKKPSKLIEELLENRYSIDMLIFSVKEKTKNSTFITRLSYNLKIILSCRSYNLIILNSLFKSFPQIYKNRLMKEDLKNYIFEDDKNGSLINKKIRNLILNDIILIKDLFNSYYEEINFSMKSNVFIENFNNFNFEMDKISGLIKV